MVLTTKHHDGFCLFDSKVSNFTSVKTAAKRDFVAEYIRACRKYKMKVGLYFSLADLNCPAYLNGPCKNPKEWKRFIAYVHNQVRELLTNYGKIDILWYDGGWVLSSWGNFSSAEIWQSRKLYYNIVKKLQPHILINSRSGIPGDFDTPEQRIVPSTSGRLWETCMTMNDHWGYHAGDKNWKSTKQLIINLVRCVSTGGNFLLNVGPKADGTIPATSIKRLKEIGNWMKKNRESIYGIKGSSFYSFYRDVSFGWSPRVTTKGNIAYLHVFYWLGRELCISRFKNKVKSANFLASGKKVEVTQKNDRLFIKNLPDKEPDPYDTVIALKLEEELK